MRLSENRHYFEAERARSSAPGTAWSIMHDLGLVAAQPRQKVRTTAPAGDAGTRPDLVKRDFSAPAPGMKWVGDITYIRTWAGFVYLATVLDCCTKKVVGYCMASHMRTSLVCDAIDMAVRNCPHTPGGGDLSLRPRIAIHVGSILRTPT